MGLGAKIKNALHGDDRRSPKGSSDYENGRLPGSFPSESETTTGRTGKHGVVDNGTSPTGRTSTDGLNTNSTLRKSQNHRHQKSDSGVDFTNDSLDKDVHHSKPANGLVGSNDTTLEQPQPHKPTAKLGGKHQDPYWGNIGNNRDNATTNTAGVDGYEKDLPLRPEQGNNRDVYAKDVAGHNGGSMLNPGHNNKSSMLDVDHTNNTSMLNPEHTHKNSVLDAGHHNGHRHNNGTLNTGNHNGGMLNNNNTLSHLDGERDPYWNGSNGSGLDGQGYGVTNGNGFSDDSMYGNTAPSSHGGDYGHGSANGFRGNGYHTNNMNNHTGTHGTHHGRGGIDDPHNVAGSGLTDRNLHSNGDRGVGLNSAGMVSPNSPVNGFDDGRIRDRDMGRSPNNYGAGAGMAGVAASEVARRHHEDDLRDSGYHGSAGNGFHHNGTNHHGNTSLDGGKLNGNSVGGSRAAYARSAGGTPPRNGMQQHQQGHGVGAGVGGPNQYGQQQQHHSGPTGSSWNGPGAHNPARVLHTCSNCGVDNDISQYFRPDVAYRLGQ